MVGDVTRLLDRVRQGDPRAREQLFTCVYGELQRIARHKLALESTLSQLDAGGLVHEAYLRLSLGGDLRAVNRAAFFAYAAGVMRSVIVDYARERSAAKRGGGEAPITLVTRDAPSDERAPDVCALDLALKALEQVDPRSHRIVELRYFAGLSLEEIAGTLELSVATVKRDWQKARAFLYRTLQS